MKRICVFCGSSQGSRSEYGVAAEEMDAELVRRNIGLVYGGSDVGLMGIVADAVVRTGGEVQGVIPEHLMAREVGHKGLTKLHVVRSITSARHSRERYRERASVPDDGPSSLGKKDFKGSLGPPARHGRLWLN
jgi:uncharacterized protein (TIGR00730 family)